MNSANNKAIPTSPASSRLEITNPRSITLEKACSARGILHDNSKQLKTNEVNTHSHQKEQQRSEIFVTDSHSSPREDKKFLHYLDFLSSTSPNPDLVEFKHRLTAKPERKGLPKHLTNLVTEHSDYLSIGGEFSARHTTLISPKNKVGRGLQPQKRENTSIKLSTHTLGKITSENGSQLLDKNSSMNSFTTKNQLHSSNKGISPLTKERRSQPHLTSLGATSNVPANHHKQRHQGHFNSMSSLGSCHNFKSSSQRISMPPAHIMNYSATEYFAKSQPLERDLVEDLNFNPESDGHSKQKRKNSY